MTSAALPAPPSEGDELVLDTSEGTPVRALRGRNGAVIRLSESARGLLDRVRQGLTFEEIAREASLSGPAVTAEAAEAAYRGLMERIERIEDRASHPRGAFWLRLRLVPARLVARLAAPLTFAFTPGAAFAAAWLGALAAARVGPLSHALPPEAFAPAFALFLLSTAVHELGHAAACARFGARPGDIGLTFYLVYPAFYSDVNDAWTLRRWQRVIVDLGGVYFQLVAGAGFALVYAATAWEPARVAVVFVLGSTLFSLNPIFKFDGYWVAADALGVTNLGGQPLRLLRHALARVRGRSPAPLPWPAPVVTVLSLYAVASVVLWGLFVVRLAPHLTSVLAGYPGRMRALIAPLGGGAPPSAATLRGAAVSTYMLAFAGLMAWRAARWGVSRMRAARGR
jgi:putative peptide zinc metalloprotease protein